MKSLELTIIPHIQSLQDTAKGCPEGETLIRNEEYWEEKELSVPVWKRETEDGKPGEARKRTSRSKQKRLLSTRVFFFILTV